MRLRDPDEFPLPFLQPVLARIKQELTAGRGFFLMKGLPVQQWTREQVCCPEPMAAARGRDGQ